MTVEWELDGQRFVGINGGPQFTFSEAVPLAITCQDQDEVDHYWERLTDCGEEGPCGWLEDRYGLSWQVVPEGMDEILNDPDPEHGRRAMQEARDAQARRRGAAAGGRRGGGRLKRRTVFAICEKGCSAARLSYSVRPIGSGSGGWLRHHSNAGGNTVRAYRLTGLVCALILVPAAVAVAGSPPAPYLVTGGGQVLADSDPSSEPGPGDTIAFVAGEDAGNVGDDNSGVFGSLQVVNTSEALPGQKPTIIFNGQVTCVEPGGETMARFGGFGRAPDGSRQAFTVDVTDTGDEERGTDMVKFQRTTEPCGDVDENELNGTTLARGNVKVDTANSAGGQ